MAKDKNKISTRRLHWRTPTITPVATTLYVSAELTGKGDVGAKADLTHVLVISDPPPPSGLAWSKDAVERLKRGPNPPKNITEASHRLFDEMNNAFLRRQCDTLWTQGHIKNSLLELDFWPRTRPLKS
jgi:hypothetical protein